MRVHHNFWPIPNVPFLANEAQGRLRQIGGKNDIGELKKAINFYLRIHFPKIKVKARRLMTSSVISTCKFDSPADEKPNLNRKEPSEIIYTKFGPIQGFLHPLVNGELAEIFLGIPFAKPPIGNLRFEARIG